MKNRIPFRWLSRLYYTYGNPVKAEYNGLSDVKFWIPKPKKGEVKVHNL